MLKNKKLLPVFGKCENFYPKFFHFSKLIHALEKNPDLFTNEKNLLTLGISITQLKSLKYWGIAFKLIKENNKKIVLTNWGQKIFSINGIDPYLEETVTTLYLHKALLESTCIVPSWYFTFMEFRQTRFKEEDLILAIEKWALMIFPDVLASRNLIKKDVRCILKMYTENIPDNPFIELNLLHFNGESYEFRRGV